MGVPFKILASSVSNRCKRNVLKFCCFKFSGPRNKLTEVTQAEKMDIKTVMCVTSRMIVEVPTLWLSRNLVLFKMFIKLCSVHGVHKVMCFQNMFTRQQY